MIFLNNDSTRRNYRITPDKAYDKYIELESLYLKDLKKDKKSKKKDKKKGKKRTKRRTKRKTKNKGVIFKLNLI